MSVLKQYVKDRARFLLMYFSDWFEEMMDYRWFRRTVGITEGVFLLAVLAGFFWLSTP